MSFRKILKKISKTVWVKRNQEQGAKKGKLLYGVFLFVIFIGIGTYIFPRDKSPKYAEYRIGTVAPERIISPDTFPINKSPEEYESEKEEKRKGILARFYRDTNAENEAIKNMGIFFNYLNEFRETEKKLVELNKKLLTDQGKQDTLLIKQKTELSVSRNSFVEQIERNNNIDIEKQNWAFIHQMSHISFENFKQNCIQILKDMYSIGMLNVSKQQNTFENIDLTLREDTLENAKNINEFFDGNDSYNEISNRLEAAYTPLSDIVLSPDTISVGLETIQSFLIANPNIKYDSEITERLRDEAAANVGRSRGFVSKNEKIIDSYEKITEEHYQKIQSLREYLAEQGRLRSRFSVVLLYFGQIGFLALILFMFVLYLFQFRPAIIKDTKNATMIFLIFLTQLLFIYLVTQQLGLSEYLIPTTIASMLLAILFDGGVGIYGTLVVSFMVGGYLGNDFGITIYALAGGVAAVIAVRHIRHLIQFLKAILYILLFYTLVLYIIGIMQGMTLVDIFWDRFIFSLPNAIFSPLITLGFLALFEMLFGVTTDMTLLELSDLNRPLLRELVVHAPGTYHHSIILGNLSERAAEAIGANSLLARVGCYYHDIGKMVKPQYFIENEQDAKEKHDALAPTMSSLIISSHVKEGIAIARKYKLPNIIKDFINQHHGTSKISFFFEKALEKSKDSNLNPADFCYPGPKPQTKEAGIAMLADGVEAATRALKDPSSARIRERVESIVTQRFQEGQLDECDLTMKDLRAIIESFIQILTGIFHERIEYPNKDKGKTTASEEKIIGKQD